MSRASPPPDASRTPSAPAATAPAGAPPLAHLDRWIVVATLVPFLAITVAHVAGSFPTWLYLATLLLGSPHVLATFGLYVDEELWPIARGDLLRFVWIPVAIVALAVTAFATAAAPVAILLVTGFFIWQTQHYTKQNLGVFSFWCRIRRAPAVREAERSLIRSTTAIGVLGILRAMDLTEAGDPMLRGAGLALLAIGAVLAVCLGRGARRWALLATVGFYAPLHVYDVDLLTAAFAYQAAHGAQYYLMVGAAVRTSRRARRLVVPAVVVGSLVPLTILTPTMLVAQPWLFGLGKGLAAAHFFADAQWWRLRDPKLGPVLRRRFGLD